MGTRRERRHIVRLAVPSLLCSLGLQDEEVRLVDLSPAGARIEHDHRIPDWKKWFLVLPRALGGARLEGEVVWSRVAGVRKNAEGERQVFYQSGMVFRLRTLAQQAGLAAALEILNAPREG